MLPKTQIGNNVYAVFDLAETDSVFDKVSIMMINSNQTHNIGLAPISFDGMNGCYTKMKFDITGKISIKEYISKNISQNDFRMMLINLVDALENFDEYMIDSKQVLLDLDSVFINTIDYKVVFLCIALKNREQKSSLYGFFKEIVENSFVTTGFNETSYFNRAYNVVRSENGFSIQNIKNAMTYTENPSAPAQTPQNMKPVQPQPVQPLQPNVPNNMAMVSPQTPKPPVSGPSVPPAPQQSIPPRMNPNTPIQLKKPDEPTKKKGLLGGLFSSSKKKKSEPDSSKYSGGLAGLKNNTKSNKNNVSAPSPMPNNANPMQGNMNPMTGAMPNNANPMQGNMNPMAGAMPNNANPMQGNMNPMAGAVPNNAGHMQGNANVMPHNGNAMNFGGTNVLNGGMANPVNNVNPAGNPGRPDNPGYNSLNNVQFQGTTVLKSNVPNQSAGTTVLKKPEENGYVGTTVLDKRFNNSAETTVLSKPKNAVLIRSKTGERFFINKQIFAVGRDMTNLDCDLHDNTNVGHKHANIIIRNSEYYLIDMNSTNHTYINKNVISPNTETKLSEGDIIHFADEEFKFCFI